MIILYLYLQTTYIIGSSVAVFTCTIVYFGEGRIYTKYIIYAVAALFGKAFDYLVVFFLYRNGGNFFGAKVGDKPPENIPTLKNVLEINEKPVDDLHVSASDVPRPEFWRGGGGVHKAKILDFSPYHRRVAGSKMHKK